MNARFWFSGVVWALFLVSSLQASGSGEGEKDSSARPPTQQELAQRRALQLYSRALLQKREFRLLEAIKSLEEASRLDPESAVVQKTLGGLYVTMDRSDDALTAFKKSLELDSGDGETWYLFAKELRQREKRQDAVSALQRAVDAEALKDRPELRFPMFLELAELLEEAKKPAEAADAFEQMLKLLDKPEPLIVRGVVDPEQVLARSAELLELVGRNAAKAKQYQRSVTAFRRAQEVDPSRASRVSFNLSEIYLAQEDYENALTSVNFYLKSQPTAMEPYERKILLLEKLKRSSIVPELSKHLADDPNNQSLRLLTAAQMAKAGQHSEAETHYQEMARKSPTAEVYQGLFALYQKLGNPGDRILRELNEAIKKAGKDDQPGDPLAAAQGRSMLAVLREDGVLVKAVLAVAATKVGTGELVQQTRLFLASLADHTKQLAVAEQLYRSCLREGGLVNRRDEQELYSGLLRILWRGRKFEEIVAVCKQGLTQSRFTNRVLFYADMARALAQLGKGDEALKQADAAIAVAGAAEQLYARRTRVLVLVEMERYDNAVEECRTMIKEAVSPEEIRDSRYTLASVYSQSRNFAKAEEQYRILIETDPSDATACNDLGYIWADQGKNLDEAEKLVRKALELDTRQRRTGGVNEEGENAAYIDSLAWVLFRRGQPKAAVAELERAVKLLDGAEDPVVWDHLGDIYFRLQERAKASDAWKKSIELYENGRRRKADDRYKEVKAKLKLVQ